MFNRRVSAGARRIDARAVLLGAVAATTTLGISGAGSAQTRSPTAELETVTVTAEKRETPLQKTPVAATVFTASALENNRIVSFSDLAIAVPNLTYTQFSSQESYFSIRGTLINNNGAGWDDAVTTFIDGVPTTGLGDQDPDLFDLSSIEVLRGPQGTVFGRNVTGGAIVIHTLPPAFNTEGKAQLTYGVDNMVQARGLLTGALIGDDVAGKLSFSYNHRDDYIDNIALGGQTAGTNEYDVRGQMLWDAASNLEVLLGADLLKDRSGGYATKLFGNFIPALFPTLSYSPDVTNQGFNGSNHRDIYGTLARVKWTNPIGVLTSITGYRNVDDYFPNNLLGDPQNQILALGLVHDKQVTEEIDLASPSDGPLTWVTGVFYLHSSKRESNPLMFNFNPLTVAGLFSPATTYTQFTDQRISTDSYAIFGEGTYAFTDEWKLTLGARETWERKAGTSVVAYNIVNPGLPPGSATYSRSWNAFTPKGTLTFEPTNDLMTYATIARGFKSGGYDLSGANGTTTADVSALLGLPFAPETEWSYEIGEKYTGFDNRLVFDADAFRADYKNLQTSQLVLSPNNVPTMVTSNAPGTTTVQGVEVEANATPKDWLTLGLTYAYMNAQFATGKTIPYAPRHQVHLSAEADYPVSGLGGTVALAGDFTFHSKVFFNNANDTPKFVRNNSEWGGIVNMHLAYTSDDQLWNISLWGKNITDERPLLHAADITVLLESLAEFGTSDAVFLAKYYPERTFGITVTRSF